ncbi:MAG TPA: type II secretion system protein, partial [Candidatus Saccharimonadales bacterium]|nr:type II secretion system protein [Candidatus Saccharimonadales bacterium]
MGSPHSRENGFTLVELTVTLVVFMIVAISLFGLFTSLVRSTIIAKREAVATSLATNEMEYLKSLPYDTLAVAGGSIYATNPLPASTAKTLNGVKYTVKTSINYIDDAYDGCFNYGSPAATQLYCRNYPPPSGSPATDSNPQDYKIVHVTVTDKSNLKLAQVDTQISSRVSETASTTGAIFVTVIDNNGNKISGATVTVTNVTITPAANVSDTSDSNGTAIFYGLPPDNGTDYIITASKTGFSSLTTIPAAGALQPTYPSQKILTQQSSFVTLTLKQQAANSLIVETVDASGNPLPNVKVYIKGGYKKYTAPADTAYYYDNLTPSDARPVTDASGLTVLQNLTPGQYIFCGDAGGTSCTVGATTYYAIAAVPYGGTNPFNPVAVPSYDPAAPPVTFDYSGAGYMQKVRLMLTTSANYPRVTSVNPSNVSKTGGTIGNQPFTVTGTNLPCSSIAASCST